jgi:ribonuclease BN (tRNA processing enzyme)
MSAQPIQATIFAYQVGFGDCFLVRFTYEDDSRRHMLIDFGTTDRNLVKMHMPKIAADIRDKCMEPGGGRLDVVVATHRHADHISGFATADDGTGTGTGDIIASLKPRVVIQPWTEAPEAPTDWEGPEGETAHEAFTRRVSSLNAMEKTAEAALEFLATKPKGASAKLAAELRFIGEDNLSNVSAVKNLQAMAPRRLFVFHGCDTELSEELPGIGVTVLGPPTLKQTDSIKKQRSKDPDEFWQLAPKRLTDAIPREKARRSKSTLFPTAKLIPGTRLFLEQRWLAKRLDECNAEMVLSLVRALDDQMNNTSVILLFDAGSKRLLFPGDAQIENWRYALQSPLASLLDSVDLYKVGHHGSRNATPRSLWKKFARKGPKTTPGRLTSVMSTRHGKHGSVESHTEVPRQTLVNALDAESDLYSTETLATGELYRKVEIAL